MGKITVQGPKQRRVAESILRLHADDKYTPSAVHEECPDVGKPYISRIARVLKDNAWQIPGAVKSEVKPPVKQTEQVGGQFATITEGKPAAVIFALGQTKIDVDPQAFYESYLLYLDLQRRLDLKDGFASAIRDALGFMWRLVATQPQIRNDQVEILIGGTANGRLARQSEGDVHAGDEPPA